MRILILTSHGPDDRNWGHWHWCNEFRLRYDNVFYFGPKRPRYDANKTVPELVDEHKPDIVCCFFGHRSKDLAKEIAKTDIPRVIKPQDYTIYLKGNDPTVQPTITDHEKRWNDFFEKCGGFDLYFGEQYHTCEAMISYGFDRDKIISFPFSVHTGIYRNMNLEKEIDVMSSVREGLYYYPNRLKVRKLLGGLPLNVHLEKVFHYDYIRTINKSKLFVTGTDRHGSLHFKYMEVMACGTMMLTDRPYKHEKVAGFVDGEHFVIYDDMADLEQKIYYYLENEEERERIAKQGMRLVQERHSNERRIQEWADLVRKLV